MSIKQAVVVAAATVDPSKDTEELALFNANGTPFSGRSLSYGAITTATAIGTAAKTVSDAEPAANTLVPIKFTNGNTAASPTVAFAGGTARSVLLGGTAPLGGECTLGANGVALFWFDGTALHQVGVYS